MGTVDLPLERRGCRSLQWAPATPAPSSPGKQAHDIRAPPLTPPPPAKYGQKLATPPPSPPSLPSSTLSSSPLPNPDSPALPYRHPSLSSICGRQRCSWHTGACRRELGAAADRTLPYSPTPSPLPTTSSNSSSGNWHAFIKRACSCFEQLHLQQVPPKHALRCDTSTSRCMPRRRPRLSAAPSTRCCSFASSHTRLQTRQLIPQVITRVCNARHRASPLGDSGPPCALL